MSSVDTTSSLQPPASLLKILHSLAKCQRENKVGRKYLDNMEFANAFGQIFLSLGLSFPNCYIKILGSLMLWVRLVWITLAYSRGTSVNMQ